jgi:hypothetical protein
MVKMTTLASDFEVRPLQSFVLAGAFEHIEQQWADYTLADTQRATEQYVHPEVGTAISLRESHYHHKAQHSHSQTGQQLGGKFRRFHAKILSFHNH